MKNKTKLIIGIIIILVLAGLIVLLLSNKNKELPEEEQKVLEEVIEEENVAEELLSEDIADVKEESPKMSGQYAKHWDGEKFVEVEMTEEEYLGLDQPEGLEYYDVDEFDGVDEGFVNLIGLHEIVDDTFASNVRYMIKQYIELMTGVLYRDYTVRIVEGTYSDDGDICTAEATCDQFPNYTFTLQYKKSTGRFGFISELGDVSIETQEQAMKELGIEEADTSQIIITEK